MGKRKVIDEISKVFDISRFKNGMENRECIEWLLSEYKLFLEDLGYNVIGVYLKGSQNYNLEDKDSDVDATAVVIPTFGDLLTKKQMSKKYKFNTGEVLVNDLYRFVELCCTGNIGWIEMINTDYYVGDKIPFISEYLVNPDTIVRMCKEKLAALSKRYESKIPLIEKFGFDPKQLHHIIRLAGTLAVSIGGDIKSHYREDETHKVKLLELKRNGVWEGELLDVHKARDLCNRYISTVERLSKHWEYDKVEIPLKDVEDYMMNYYFKRENV